MILIAVGVPSPFSAWGFEVVKRVLASSASTMLPQIVDRLDEVRVPDDGVGLYLAQFPSPALSRLAKAHPSRTIVFAASPIEAVAYQMETFNISLIEAVRAVGASLALLDGLAHEVGRLILDERSPLDTMRLIHAIADHYSVKMPEGRVESIADDIGPIPAFKASERFDESDEGIITLVLGDSVAHLLDPTIPLKSIWPYRVFFSGDRPSEEAPLVAEATGGARVIYYGPYFHLPAGRWLAKLTLGFSKDAAGLPLKVAFYGPDLLGEAKLRAPRGEGVFAAQLSFDVTTPEHPIELHIRTEEGAIEGRVALGQVEMLRTDDDRPVADIARTSAVLTRT